MDKPCCILIFFTVTVAPIAVRPQDLPTQAKPGSKVCVAVVSNVSPRSVLADRLTERLTKDLNDDKRNAFKLESTTTTDFKLHLTRENGEEAKGLDCDYVLVTQVTDPKARPFDPQGPQISIGGKVPSIDASDPMGGSSGPVYRDNLQIRFALFPIESLKAVLDTVILAQPSGNVSDNLLSAMDRESSRVSHELKKK